MDFWGEGNQYDFSDLSDWVDDIANGGGMNRKVIIVAPSTEHVLTFTDTNNARFPAAFQSTVGVTGINDDTHGNDSWKLILGDDNGYGIDIAAIDDFTTIPWSIGEGGNIFKDVCNSVVFVTGIVALLKQYYDPLTISQLQQTFKNTGDTEGDSPKNYGEESGGSYFSLNPYDENFNFGTYPGNYRIAWGIIDAYETYLYIKNNIVP